MGSTFFHANFSSRRRVIQIFARGARILDGAFMTQDLSLKSSNTETSVASDGAAVLSVSIADPYVLLKMNDGSIQLLVGGMSGQVAVLKLISVSEKLIHTRGCVLCIQFAVKTLKYIKSVSLAAQSCKLKHSLYIIYSHTVFQRHYVMDTPRPVYFDLSFQVSYGQLFLLLS